MEDKIISGIIFDDSERIFAWARFTAAITTNTVSDAIGFHKPMPVGAAALGRALTGVILMSNMLKNDSDKITMQIKGDGPLGGILVTGDKDANVKGYVNNPNCDMPIRNDGKLNVSGAVGKGYLQVIKDMGMKEPYVGKIDIVSGEIAEDLTHYLAISEQIPSAVALGVLIDKDGSASRAGGFIIQMLPGAPEEYISFLEEQISKLPPITELIEKCRVEAVHNNNNEPTAEEILENVIKSIFKEKEYDIFSSKHCGYKCDCSKERMERNLITIGKSDLKQLAEEQEDTEIICHFCNKEYHFSSDEIFKLLKELRSVK